MNGKKPKEKRTKIKSGLFMNKSGFHNQKKIFVFFSEKEREESVHDYQLWWGVIKGLRLNVAFRIGICNPFVIVSFVFVSSLMDSKVARPPCLAILFNSSEEISSLTRLFVRAIHVSCSMIA